MTSALVRVAILAALACAAVYVTTAAFTPEMASLTGELLFGVFALLGLGVGVCTAVGGFLRRRSRPGETDAGR